MVNCFVRHVLMWLPVATSLASTCGTWYADTLFRLQLPTAQ